MPDQKRLGCADRRGQHVKMRDMPDQNRPEKNDMREGGYTQKSARWIPTPQLTGRNTGPDGATVNERWTVMLVKDP